MLEARDRPGGRVEQSTIPDGRIVQLGGELVGDFHTSYLELVDELGLTLRPSYVADPGEMTFDLVDGVHVGDDLPWMTDAERADGERLAGLAGALAATVDPDDPWSHPDAARLDRLSVNGWLREQDALPAVIRAREVAPLSVAGGSGERISLLVGAPHGRGGGRARRVRPRRVGVDDRRRGQRDRRSADGGRAGRPPAARRRVRRIAVDGRAST